MIQKTSVTPQNKEKEVKFLTGKVGYNTVIQ